MGCPYSRFPVVIHTQRHCRHYPQRSHSCRISFTVMQTWYKQAEAKILPQPQDSPNYPSRSGEEGGKIMNTWHGHHTLGNLPVLVPPSSERLTKWTDDDPAQCQPRTAHGLRRTVLNQQGLESCPANGRLNALSHDASPGSAWLEIQVAVLQDWRPSYRHCSVCWGYDGGGFGSPRSQGRDRS